MDGVQKLEKDNIVHIVARDKFTAGYIIFMEYSMGQYLHTFIVLDEGFNLDLDIPVNLIYIKKYSDLLFQNRIKKIINKCHKLIVSGVFGAEKYISFYPKKILNKTYLHFWGGDFYALRDEKLTYHEKFRRMLKRRCIKRCNGIINLIKEDYPAFVGICGIEKKHFVAPMPGDPRKKFNYIPYRKITKKDDVIRIVIGNSATKENRHIEAFELIRPLLNDKVEVLCPLSYGNEEYKNYVLKEGKKILGDNFRPLTEFMSKDNYIKFLSSCDVGIYNNDRQQGMGNISIMLLLGKKIYMAKGTSMWDSYTNYGIVLNDVCMLKNTDIKKLIEYDEKVMKNNIDIMEKRLDINLQIKSWAAVFEDDIGGGD